ncbi:MAG TPA: NifU family protein [Myxococcaceae bacterium]|nr:NifU family protein [Myxococcaceae bacterium]
MSVNIQLEWTPNPSTLKYVTDRTLMARGAVNFVTKEATEGKSPLARKLMDIPGVSAVMLGSNFVTVTKGEDGEWDEMNDAVMETIDSHLSSDEPVVTGDVLPPPSVNGSDVEGRIREILDSEIRPAVMMDGGDITLDRFENGVAYLHMQGSCAGCPSSTATLKMGIESRLREIIPEVVEVAAV